MSQKHNLYRLGKQILFSGISMGESENEPVRRPLEDVDLYFIDTDGRVHLTNIRGGLASHPCYAVGLARDWARRTYPLAQPLSSQEELNQIANERCEAYLSRKS